MSKWISVCDSHPERHTQKVIVWFNRWYSPGYLSIARWREDGVWEALESGTTFHNGNVTHWMPLPEPPSE